MLTSYKQLNILSFDYNCIRNKIIYSYRLFYYKIIININEINNIDFSQRKTVT